MKVGLTPAAAAQIPLPVFAEQVIGGMVPGYRANAALLRAMRNFVRGRENTAFWKKACNLRSRAIEHVIDLFMAHRKEIKHPDPRTAVAMAFMMVVSTVYELVVMPTDLGQLKPFLPKAATMRSNASSFAPSSVTWAWSRKRAASSKEMQNRGPHENPSPKALSPAKNSLPSRRSCASCSTFRSGILWSGA